VPLEIIKNNGKPNFVQPYLNSEVVSERDEESPEHDAYASNPTPNATALPNVNSKVQLTRNEK